MLKRTIAALAATLLGGLVGIVPAGEAHANATNVYSQPGDHLVNGRYWKTSCEMYTTKIVRCTTKIWGEKISKVGGSYVTSKGWVFNNLTYLPSARSSWASNPLGKTGSWTAKDGRKWRTECDTAATGKHGCRSYALTTVVSGSNGRYSQSAKWVFNNMVNFTSSSTSAVTKIPAKAAAISGVPQEGSKAEKVVAAALSKVGSRYVHAQAGPNAFDCSGLTTYAYKQVGVTLPRTSGSQVSAGKRVSASALQPGDLVFYYSPISHVGIYIGDGKIVDAANPRAGVRVTTLNSMPLSAAVRVLNS
ncbi:Cell wall-associated hydrolase, NlpC family [Tessaracoccus bendigoensis DSM 12906]|uniref:Cell wall-associated hydrolase, NlpC family n=1 Tax=Tessaracoccus bendigoensis DSM 12906 TaxID=1123357 RepID=A0A1M6E141_9ACTN|nr:C40 family peptidase [Tessaracoccus bendigoensis]SHI79196.1 Cell wall-associated hydrolase, NlpC family [Tessaracoccus bendigoensis DSM 12906]